MRDEEDCTNILFDTKKSIIIFSVEYNTTHEFSPGATLRKSTVFFATGNHSYVFWALYIVVRRLRAISIIDQKDIILSDGVDRNGVLPHTTRQKPIRTVPRDSVFGRERTQIQFSGKTPDTRIPTESVPEKLADTVAVFRRGWSRPHGQFLYYVTM